MALNVVIEKNLTDGHFAAIGTLSYGTKSFPAEVLVKQKSPGVACLTLNSKLQKSKVDHEEVVLYTGNDECAYDGQLEPGTSLKFSNVGLQIKK